jgi:hypothetical protein
MSLRGCTLLQEAADDMGPWGYILGGHIDPTRPDQTLALTGGRRHLCSSLCARYCRLARQLDGVLKRFLVVHVAILAIGTTLIRRRTPIGPGALVVSRGVTGALLV